MSGVAAGKGHSCANGHDVESMKSETWQASSVQDLPDALQLLEDSKGGALLSPSALED
jgi:hypothetical protein